MMYRLRLFPRSDRFPLVGLLVLLALSSCGWPMDPIPTWRLRFEGTVRHSETAAPVPNTVVQFWFDTLAPGDGEPDAWGSTNADGSFRIEVRDRSLLPPAEFGVRLTPPPGSGSAPGSSEARTPRSSPPSRWGTTRPSTSPISACNLSHERFRSRRMT